MAEGRITPSKSCTCSSAQSRCVEGAAVLPSAPSMQGLFPRGRCASEQPGWAGIQVESSFKLSKHKAAQEQQEVFRLRCLQVYLFALHGERKRCGGGKKGPWLESSARSLMATAGCWGQSHLSPGRTEGVSKAPLM